MLLWLQEGREANHCLWLVVEQLLSPSLSSALLCAEAQQRYRNPLLWHKACVGGDFGAFFLPIPTCSEQWQNVPTSISSHYPQTYLTSTVCSSLVFPFVFPQLQFHWKRERKWGKDRPKSILLYQCKSEISPDQHASPRAAVGSSFKSHGCCDER